MDFDEKKIVFDNWLSLKNSSGLENKSWEIKRKDSFRKRIKRLMEGTIPYLPEYQTNKDYLMLRMYDLDEKLFDEARVWEILEHSWGGFGNWIENLLVAQVNGKQRMKLPEIVELFKENIEKDNMNDTLRKSVTDISRIVKKEGGDYRLLLGEIKNRTWTGGTASRLELMDKTLKILEAIIDNKKFCKNKKFPTLLNYLHKKKVSEIDLYQCIFFDPFGKPASSNTDKYRNKAVSDFFDKFWKWIESKKRVEEKNANIILKLFGNKTIYIYVPVEGKAILDIKADILYHDEIVKWFFNNRSSDVSSLPILPADDFKYAVKTAIKERKLSVNSPEKENNFTKIIGYLVKLDPQEKSEEEVINEIYNNKITVLDKVDIIRYLALMKIAKFIKFNQNNFKISEKLIKDPLIAEEEGI